MPPRRPSRILLALALFNLALATLFVFAAAATTPEPLFIAALQTALGSYAWQMYWQDWDKRKRWEKARNAEREERILDKAERDARREDDAD